MMTRNPMSCPIPMRFALALWGLLLALACAGCAGDDSTTDVDPRPDGSYALNEIILGQDSPNLLKGISVAFDPDRREVYVASILAGHIAAVPLDGGGMSRVMEQEGDGWEVKALAFDPKRRHLWIVDKGGEEIWIVDTDSGKMLRRRDTSVDAGSNPGAYPIRSIALDASRDEIYVSRQDGDRVLVYDSALEKRKEILAGRSSQTLVWDESNDRLLVFSVPGRDSSEPGVILALPGGETSGMTEIPSPRGRGPQPKLLAVDANGAIYVAGSSLWKLNDGGGIVWEAALDLSPAAVAVSGNEVGILFRYGPANQETYVSRLSRWNRDDGRSMGSRMARYESSHVVGTVSGFAVGNGGDASITLFPAGSGEGRTIKVGSSAEDVLLTPDGQRALVLNRLGGSQLVEVDLETGTGRTLEAGAWPIRFVARPADDKLFVLSHFESKLSLFRLSDLTPLSTIPLGVRGSTTDTIAAMAADPEGRLLAALICEQGKVVLVDGAREEVRGTVAISDVALSAGPGRLQGAVDGEGDRVFVYEQKGRLLTRLDGPNFRIAATSQVIPSQTSGGGYRLKTVFYSRQLDRLLVGDQIVNPDTLQVVGRVPNVHRVVGESQGRLWGQRRGANGLEVLVTLDSGTLESLGEQSLGTTSVMSSAIWISPDQGRALVANPSASTLSLVPLLE